MTNATITMFASFSAGSQEIIGATALCIALLGILVCAVHLASYFKSGGVSTNAGDVVICGWVLSYFMTSLCAGISLSQSFHLGELNATMCSIEAFILPCVMMLQSLMACARSLILLYKISGAYVFDAKAAWFMTFAIYAFAIVWTSFFSLGTAPNINLGNGLFCFINVYQQNGVGVLCVAAAAAVVHVFESSDIYSATKAQIIRSRVNASLDTVHEINPSLFNNAPVVSKMDEVKKLEDANVGLPDLTSDDRRYLARLFWRTSLLTALTSLSIVVSIVVQWCGPDAPPGLGVLLLFSILVPPVITPILFSRFIPAQRRQIAALLGVFGRRYSLSDSNSHSHNEASGVGGMNVDVDHKDTTAKSVDEGETLPNGLFLKMTFVARLKTSVPMVSRVTVWRLLDWQFGMDLAKEFEATHEPKLHVPELIEFLIRVKKFETIAKDNQSAPNIGWSVAKKIVEDFIHEEAASRVNFSAKLFAVLSNKFLAESTTIAPTGTEFEPAVDEVERMLAGGDTRYPTDTSFLKTFKDSGHCTLFAQKLNNIWKKGRQNFVTQVFSLLQQDGYM